MGTKQIRTRRKPTPRAQRVAVDFILAVLNNSLLRQKDHSSFRGTVGSCTRFQAHQAQQGGRIYDPSSVTRRMRILRQELRDSIFAAKEDGAGIDLPGGEREEMSKELSSMRAHDQSKKPLNICLHRLIPRSFIHLVAFSSRLGTSSASVIDHPTAFRAFSLKEPLCQCEARESAEHLQVQPSTHLNRFCINISISDTNVTSAWTYIALFSP